MSKATKILRTPAAPAKTKPAMIPAAVVLSEADSKLKKIEAVLGSTDQIFAAIEEDNPWAVAVSYIVSGTHDEIKELREYLDGMVISGKDGSALGIEKGGAQ